MYELLDKPAAIREVQRFLYLLSDNIEGIPRIAIDGIYEDETRDAVLKFQTLYNLQPTGIVDLNTFNTLYTAYALAVEEKSLRDYVITQNGFPIKLGDQSADVLVINLIISELEKTYTDIGTVQHSKYFSEDSRNATMELQKIFTYPITGEIDARFYDRLKIELDALDRLNTKYE